MGFHDLSYMKRLEILKLKTLDSMRNIRILKKVFAIKKLRHNIPKDWFEFYKFSIKRNGTFLEVPKTRIFKCDKKIFVYSITLFNSLPDFIKNCNHFSLFYKYLDNFFT